MKVTVAGFGMGYIARLASALRVAQAGLQNDGHQPNQADAVLTDYSQ